MIDASPDTTTLALALPREIARVSRKVGRWEQMRIEYESDPVTRSDPGGAPMTIGLALMRQTVDRAIEAMGRGDVVEMIGCYHALTGYSDDD